MQDCPQDAVHHAEGDVWIHVRMVAEALAALRHDVAKPICTRIEDGRLTSRGHSQRGAILARHILWTHNADLLSILARADALGRCCHDQQGLLHKIDLFEEFAREQNCLEQPWPFPAPLGRFEYFRREDRDPHYEPHGATGLEVLLMSHAPHIPVISLDGLREQLGIAPTEAQGEVVQAAREHARTYLRARKGFIWNATNLSRDLRSQAIELCTSYQASVRIIYVEARAAALFERNRQRPRPVPPAAIERMLQRWDTPGPTEAPAVEWWENAAGFVRRK
ncbi:MAG: AAA family ATPase [Bryobacteraceae bacterium]